MSVKVHDYKQLLFVNSLPWLFTLIVDTVITINEMKTLHASLKDVLFSFSLVLVDLEPPLGFPGLPMPHSYACTRSSFSYSNMSNMRLSPHRDYSIFKENSYDYCSGCMVTMDLGCHDSWTTVDIIMYFCSYHILLSSILLQNFKERTNIDLIIILVVIVCYYNYYTLYTHYKQYK